MDYLYLEGLFVGSLNDLEMDDFERLVKEGKAYRSYEGVGGMLGLAKVRLWRQHAAKRLTNSKETICLQDTPPN